MNVRYLVISLLLSLFTCPAFAQWNIPYDSVCCMPYKARAAWLERLRQQLNVAGNREAGGKTVENIKKYAAQQNEEYQLEAQLLEADYLEIYYPEQKEKILGLIENGIQRARKANFKALTVRFLSVRQRYCDKLQDYQLKFATLNEMEQLLESMTEEEIYDKTFYYIQIANAYYPFREYRLVIERLRTILSWEKPVDRRTALGLWHTYNTMGLCYRKLGLHDSSDYYFEKIRNEPYIREHEPHLYAIAAGNLGINHYLQNEFEAAMPLLELDVAASLKAGDYNNAAGSMIPQADILLQQGKHQAAKKILDSVGQYIERHRIDLADRRVAYFPLLARWYQANGQAKAAAVALDSALAAQREYDQKFNHLKVSLYEQRQKISDYQSELESNQARNRRYLLFALLLTGGLATWITYRRITGRKNQHIKDLQLREAQQHLEQATLQLNQYTRDLMSKNREIESLQEKVKAEEAWDMVNDLKTVTLITEDDWDNFRHRFERVHSGFIHRLNAQYPTLTSAEQRLAMLIKLKLGPQEMALMLGISAESVRIAHYRLRQKLGVTAKQELNEIIENL